MAMVKVFKFKHVDDDINEDVVAPRMATREAIQRVRGEAIDATMQMVDESELDGNGFYPKKPK
jgi:hypothetical protein